MDFLHHMQKQINEHVEMVQESFKKYEPALHERGKTAVRHCQSPLTLGKIVGTMVSRNTISDSECDGHKTFSNLMRGAYSSP